MSKGRDAARTVTAGLLVGFVLLAAGGCIFCFKQLLTPWWIPAVTTLVMTVALWLPMRGLWRWLTGTDNVAVSIICQIIAVWPVAGCAVMAVNMAGPGKDPVREDVTVTRVYQETRHQTRRVGRRTYAQGPAYKVCRIDIEIPEGTTRSLDVPRKVYNRLVKGDTIGIDVCTGMLGMRYFDSADLHLSERHTRERKRETMRERRHRRYQEHADRIRGINRPQTSDEKE